MLSVRVLPSGGDGKNPLQTILTIAVIAGAAIVGGLPLGTLSVFGAEVSVAALAAAGVGLAGSLLINAIAPPPTPKFDRLSAQQDSPTYSIAGGSNELRPWGPVPLLQGTHRIYPPYAAQPHTEIVGDQQFWRAPFLIGYGPVRLRDLKIGETPIGDFAEDEMEVEVREGFPGEPPRALFTDDVFEESLGIALTEADGWQQRTIQQEADEISVDITFATGLARIAANGARQNQTVTVEIEYAVAGTGQWSVPGGGRAFAARTAGPMAPPPFRLDDDGSDSRHRRDRVVMDRLSGDLTVLPGQSHTSSGGAVPPPVPPTAVPIAHVLRVSGETTISANRVIDERPEGAPFALVADFAPSATAPESNAIDIAAGTLFSGGIQTTARQTTTVRRDLRFPTQTRAIHDVRMRRITPDTTDPQIVDKVSWSALRSIRNVDPVQLDGMATVTLRARATGRLNGVIQQFNCIGTSVALDWTGSSWVEQETNNPASLYRRAFQGPHMKRPRTDAEMDLAGLQEWADANRAAGRAFNAYIDFRTTLRELTGDIAAAGRASRGMVDGKWSVVRDRPQSVPAQILTPRNSKDFRATKAFVDPPHGLTVRFVNEEIGFKRDERIVFADGFDADTATRLEALDLFGITNPDLAWQDGRFHQAVAKLRPETYELNADFEHIVAMRGDRIDVAHDAILVGLAQGRIKVVQVDGGGAATGVTLDELMTMELGKTYALIVRPPDVDPVTRAVNTVPGETDTVVFATTIPPGTIAVGDLAAFGETDRVTAEMIIREIKPGADESAKLILVDAAPEVHDSDQGPIPAFESNITLPAGIHRPAIASIRSDGAVLLVNDDGTFRSRIVISLLRSSTALSRFRQIETVYRVAGADVPWQPGPTLPITATEISIVDVEDGETYGLRFRYLAAVGEPGDWTAIFTETVVGVTAPPPDVEELYRNGDEITWSYPDPPLDLAGFRVRSADGLVPNWPAAVPEHTGLLSAPPFDISGIVAAGGKRTIMVKAIDAGGRESVTAALLFVNLGDPPVTNIVLTTAYAPTFPGTVSNGALVVGELVADDDGGLFLPDPNALFLPDPNVLFLPVQWQAMTYAAGFSPPGSDLPADLLLGLTIEGDGFEVVFRTGGTGRFLPDAEALFLGGPAADGDLFLGGPGKFRPWPGRLVAERLHYDFEIRVGAGNTRGQISAFTPTLDVPDLEEVLPDVAIASGGSRLALTKPFRKVVAVSLTLQQDGQGASRLEVVDKDHIAGPLVEGYANDNSAAPATVDAIVKGY